MTSIFMSYSHDDRPSLDFLASSIRDKFGSDCLWFDAGIPGGSEWENTIKAEIEKCQVFIFLVSQESCISLYCQEELRYALQLKKDVLPVIVRRLSSKYPGNVPEDIKGALERIQYIDLSGGFDQQKLVELEKSIYFLAPQLREFYDDRRQSNTSLTFNERWILSNQFAILAKLDPDNRENYEGMAEVIERGYELHYHWISEYIYRGKDILTAEECSEVLDILDMYDCLKHTYENIQDKTNIDTSWITFPGFDGNHEGKYLGYLRYLVDREDRYTWLYRGDNFNSHMPVLDVYRRMLVEWRKSRNKHNLSQDDLLRIIAAANSKVA